MMTLPLDDRLFWHSLICAHEGWLSGFDGQYLDNWRKLLNSDVDAALFEVTTRHLLDQRSVDVKPFEHIHGLDPRPDFLCSQGDSRFYVEATSVESGKGKAIGYDIAKMLRMVAGECREKYKQARERDAPLILAIGTFDSDLGRRMTKRNILEQLLTGKTSWEFDYNFADRTRGEIQTITTLYGASYLENDTTIGDIVFRNSPFSAILLIGASSATLDGRFPAHVRGVLHPNPTHVFDAGLLPDIEFGRVAVDGDIATLNIEWPTLASR